MILGALCLLKIWVVDPYTASNASLLTDFQRNLRLQRKAEEIMSKRRDITTLEKQGEETAKDNQQHLFLPGKGKNPLLAMQKQVNALLKKHELKVKSITMGEISVAEQGGYSRLPVAFSFSGSEKEFTGFLSSVYNNRELMILENLTLSVQRKKLQARGLLVGFAEAGE